MKHILIIDDEQDFCYFTKMSLEETGGFKVSVCYNGLDGLRLAKKLKPDMILLDILMPEMDGTRVAEELKASKDTEGIPFVFLTAMVKEEELSEGGNFIGGHQFISKPIQIQDLIKIIEEKTK